MHVPMNIKQLSLISGLFLMLGPCIAASESPEANQTVVGWLENVNLGKKTFVIRAKIDSGADNSSVNAVNSVVYEKDGKEWVRFDIQNAAGQKLTIDRPVVRNARIKKKDGGYQKRKVIELDICLAGIKKTTQVNLVDRSHFKYQVLIGRSFLKPEFLISSDRTYSKKPVCE